MKSSVLGFTEMPAKKSGTNVHVYIQIFSERYQHFLRFNTSDTRDNLKQGDCLNSSLFLILLHL